MIDPQPHHTAEDIIRANGNPRQRYARNEDNDQIAVWEGDRWRIAGAKITTGQWRAMTPLLANGINPFPGPWTEVPIAPSEQSPAQPESV